MARALSLFIFWTAAAQCAEPPPWMRAQVNAELPAHDDKADAALLYSETILEVAGPGKIKRLDRKVYKILRPDGEQRGIVRIDYSPTSRILSLHGWSIPVGGKPYEVKDKDAVDVAIPDVENGYLISDARSKLLRIPAATVGNLVGYEVQQEVRPYVLVDEWDYQSIDPLRESHYRLQLPPNWTYTTAWINRTPIEPATTGTGQSDWVTHDAAAVPIERDMPPWQGISQRMVVSLIPPAGQEPGIRNWHDLGVWYQGLLKERRDASTPIKQKVADITMGQATTLAKMQALARFVQTDIRYVAIELGIGGWQPHRAGEVFEQRLGDCKDKANLLSVMLQEIGVASYHLVINTYRGSVAADTPANLTFNHAILAIAIPAGVEAPSFAAIYTHPKLGRLLIFDPTNEYVPLGQLSGSLQGNFALLIAPDGGELIATPQLPVSTNGVARSARMTLDEQGNLSGDMREILTGDLAWGERSMLRNVTQETDRIRPIEALAADSLSTYSLSNARIVGLNAPAVPFEWKFTLEANRYAKIAGDLLLVRPRIVGRKSSALLETREPRRHPIEFEGPRRDEDNFEIAVPATFELDELPPPVDINEDFAAYHSKTEFKDHALRYNRSFEIKAVSLPAARAGELKQFYRRIADDERNTAVFKHTAH